MPKYHLLSSNAKLDKCRKDGVYALGLQLAPHNLSGFNVCKHVSKGCAASCLFFAGKGSFPHVKAARIRRTKEFFDKETRPLFMAKLIADIAKALRYAVKNDMRLAIRLNTLSDLPWERIKYEGWNLFKLFPYVTFFDYSKSVQRCIENRIPNYHLTFSRSESNEAECERLMRERPDANIAVVFKDHLPKMWKGRKVIDCDNSDSRFLDPKGVICGLLAKGRARTDQTGFVIRD